MALRLVLPLLLLAATLLTAQAQGIGSSGKDCCLKNSQRVIHPARVTSYRIQEPEPGCLLHAVVFNTKKGKKICASPTDPTVQGIMQDLDKKVKNDKDKKVKNDKDKKKGRSQHSRGRPKQRRQQRV